MLAKDVPHLGKIRYKHKVISDNLDLKSLYSIVLAVKTPMIYTLIFKLTLHHRQPFLTTLANMFQGAFAPTKTALVSAVCWGIFSLGGIDSRIAQAQEIIPASDGTNTIVTPNSNTIDITGGTTSPDGVNLFHSFEKFGVSSQQIANFQANPAIQNILGRVTGGDASIINGLIQVTGGNPNLFLMNPAGFIFGANASLNVPSSFTATTADGISFDEQWFNAIGDNNYTSLVGAPNGFAFTMNQPGSIINAGNLRVGTGEGLSLLGGTVVNTGELTAPTTGQILVISLPGENWVRISQLGSILSLEIQPITPNSNQPNNWTLNIPSLPELLTVGSDSSLTVDSNGNVKLTDTGLKVENGDVVVNKATANTATISANRNLTLPASQISTTGNLSLLAGNIITVRDSSANFFSANAGGNFYIQGNQGIDVFTIDNLGQTPFVSGGQLTFVSDGNIDILSSLIASGGVELTAGGNLKTGIINTFTRNDSSSSQQTATGGIVNIKSGGNIDIKAIDSSAASNYGDSTGGNVTLEAGGNINIGSINSFAESELSAATAGNITLISGSNINTGDIDSSTRALETAKSGVVNFQVNNSGNIVTGTINTSAISFNSLAAYGGDVSLLANGVVRALGVLDTNDTIISSGVTEAGSVTIQHDGGADNLPFVVGDSSLNGTQGNINTGISEITPTSEFPVLPNGGNADTTPSNIAIISTNSPPTITANSQLPTTEENQSVTFKFSDLSVSVNDVDRDNFTIGLDNLSGTVTLADGTPVTRETTLASDTVLVYKPPVDTSGQNIPAFEIIASDGVSDSSAPVSINITPKPKPTPPEPPIPKENGQIVQKVEQAISTQSSISGSTSVKENSEKENSEIVQKVEQAISNNLTSPGATVSQDLQNLEGQFSQDVANFLGVPSPEIKTLQDTTDVLRSLEKSTGIKPALIYLNFVPVEIVQNTDTKNNKSTAALNSIAESDQDELEILLVTGQGDPIRKRITGATKAKVLQLAQEFRNQVVNPQNRRGTGYLKPSQQLYNWIIADLEADLQAKGINNLVFISDVGLRTTPLVALHDGKQFLVEKYSVGLMPSLSLTNTRYSDIKNSPVLAVGVSQSTQGQQPLPAVPFELSTLVSKLRSGKLLLDQQATLDNLKMIRRQQPLGIIHLATHADFIPGPLSNSYIQLWNDKLRLNQLRQLRLNDPPVEMLVLSACRTALGDEEVEIGFAGLAVLAGVKTSIASLWAVNDASTAAFMTRFYESLKTAPIRAEALREAQVAMARGQIYIQDTQVRGLESSPGLPLPAESVTAPDMKLTHPYYWAAFTMVGSPW